MYIRLLIKDLKIKMRSIFAVCLLDISLMMPENQIESVPLPWITRQAAPEMLKFWIIWDYMDLCIH